MHGQQNIKNWLTCFIFERVNHGVSNTKSSERNG